MQEILEKKQCCGCGACLSVCPKKAISMKVDAEGFEYPEVNQEACINCGLCQKTCPVIHYDEKQTQRESFSSVQLGIAACNRNMEQRLKSSSGSIFPVIAEHVLDQGGIVFGAAYDENFNVVYKGIDTKGDLPLLQGSKYLQVKTNPDTFRVIKNSLQSGRIVLFSAMACQVEALKSYLKKDYENLYTTDLICMGIPSAGVWQKYLATFFSGEKIKCVNFKEKSIGWNKFCFYAKTDKREYRDIGMENLYLRSMFLTWNIRPSCFVCPFKKVKRFSDFTLADCWGANKLVPEINDNKGLSSVVVHSEKGKNLLESVKSKLLLREIPVDEIIKGNINMVENKPEKQGREHFYSMLDANPKLAFETLCKVPKKSLLSRVKNKLKNFLH